MNTLQTHAAYDISGLARHGISLDKAQADPTLRRIMHMTAKADQRRQARATELIRKAKHQKGTTE